MTLFTLGFRLFFIQAANKPTERILDGKEEMSAGNSEDNTASVQIEEIKCAITALPFVTKLSPVRAHKSHGAGWPGFR